MSEIYLVTNECSRYLIAMMTDSIRSGHTGSFAVFGACYGYHLVIFIDVFIVIEIFYRLRWSHEWCVIYAGPISQVMYVVMMVLNALTVGANLDHCPQSGSVRIHFRIRRENVVDRG